MPRPSSSVGEVEQLGTITCPSGILLLLDGGLAWMWSHDRQPLLPEWSEIASSADSAVDLAVRGTDALAAGVAFDRQSHPLFLYDIRGWLTASTPRCLAGSIEKLADRQEPRSSNSRDRVAGRRQPRG